MERMLIHPDLNTVPALFHPLLEGVPVYDSSCSPAAKVWFIQRDGGYYLKAAPKGTLEQEARLTRFFHQKGLAAEVLAFEQEDRDWLLTARIPGEDCIFPAYLDDPRRLCDTLSQVLRTLHTTDPGGCPVPNRTADWLSAAAANHRRQQYDLHLFSPRWSQWNFSTADEAWQVVEEYKSHLRADTLIHGDFCLPNIMLDRWNFSGLIDLDTGGVGDRHVDLFWATWSLQFNLNTDQWRDRFLDGYGRDAIEPELLRAVAAVEIFL